MPKSKRNRIVTLTKTKKKGKERKEKLMDTVKGAVDGYDNIFVFSVTNMRNNKMKKVKDQWKQSRFFYGKNKVMGMALGRNMAEEYKDNLHYISKRLEGPCGLLMTDTKKEAAIKWFNAFSESDFARSGDIATETITLDAGPLKQFPHSLEPQLRDLGLPTTLQKGIVTLTNDHVVCKDGETLTSEQARILKLLGIEMAEFKITLECVWSRNGQFEELISKKSEKTKKTTKLRVKKLKKIMKKKKVQDVEMEEDKEEEEENEDDELECN